jgi:BASS family bile acid:Na+ symporter
MPASPVPEASMEPAEIVKLALQVSIMLTVFGFGLRATVQDALYLVRHPRMLVISLVSMLIVMPFIALALVLVFDPPQLARVALVALALSPVPPILLTRQRKAGGQASYGLGLTAAVSILSIVLVPALVAFLGQLMGRPFELGPAAVAGQVVVAVVLPLAAGMLVRAVLPRAADRLKKPAALVANVVLLAAVVVVLVAAFPRLAQIFTVGTVAAIIVLTVLGLAFGHLLAGPDPGILRCWPSPALSGTRASPGGRGRELPVAGCRGGDHPVSAHRRRRVHSLHQADA